LRLLPLSSLPSLLVVLRTGCQWAALNDTETCATSTADDRFRAWVAAGVFLNLWQVGVEQCDERKGMDWEWLGMDGAMTKAPLRGKTGPNPTDRGKAGFTRSVLTEGHGVPIGVALASANCHDMNLLFSERVWEWSKILLVGTLLAPGKRIVTAVRRVMGLSDDAQFQNDHRVRNRAIWSPSAASRILLRLLLDAFVPPDAPIVLGRDNHIERRRGAMITAKGISRNPARSSHSCFVTTRGLRWLSMMLLTPIPWAQRTWAAPFLTVLAPSARSRQERGKRHKQRTDGARQMITQVRQWAPERVLIVVADRRSATLARLAASQGVPKPVTVVTRLRLDAALSDPADAHPAGRPGHLRKKGVRQPTLERRLSDPRTDGQHTSVLWCGGTTRTVRLASGTAVWQHRGVPPVRIRWALITDPERKFEPRHCCARTRRPRQRRSWRGSFNAGGWR